MRPAPPRGRARCRALLPGVVVWLLAASVAGAAAETAGAPKSDPGRLVFLLEYVGTDYDGAVRDGAIVNESEYGEVLRFTKELIREYGPPRGASDPVATGLRDLEQRIERRAPADEVWAATRRLLPDFVRALGGAARPDALPNLSTGRRLWADDCAPCHGVTGAGDGPAAGWMDPPPTAFRGDALDRLSPRQVYSALTFGVEGTGMPSFSQAYSERQRWDVAFFLMTLRVDFDPKRPAGNPQFTLDEIAASSNAELLARLRQTRPAAAPGEADYLRVNFLSPAAVAGGGADAGASNGLAVALQMQDAFNGIADRILPRVVGVASYVRDPEWAPEKLRTTRGEAWMAANPDLLRYPGFRQVRTGSGLLVDDEGYVLSCDHVVRDEHGEVAELLDVELQDQAHFATALVGAEPTLDLALLRIAEPTRIGNPGPELEFADSDTVQVGHWLIALGNPPGPEKTFAVGVVSAAAERQCYQAQLSATRLQSSLVVSQKGLGGPVVDILGHVVGLTVHQAAASDVATGDGPAYAHILPINLVLNLAEALKVAHSRRSPWIGVSVLELPLLRRRLGSQAQAKIFPQTGVYIDDVFDPSPASRAGVRPGDFLLALGGHRLLAVADFQTWLYVLGIGTEADLELMRDGKPLRLPVKIEVRPESATTR